MSNKNKIVWFLICPFSFIIFLLYFISVAYFYDPLQLFSEKYPNRYVENTRLAAKRVIDNYDFDGVYLGTSMLLMSDPKELKDGKYINITLDGSSIKERSYLLDYLLLNKKITSVIYTLDGIRDDLSFFKKDFSLLYQSNSVINKIKIYFQGLIPYMCFFALSKHEECIGRMHNYYDLQKEFVRPDYILNKNDFKLKRKNFIFIRERENIKKYILKYVKENPNINFHIVIPPYHILYYKIQLDYLIGIYKIGIEELSKYANVKIYFFGNERFSENVNNWQNDLAHYKKHINSRINKAINEGANIITADNMDEEFDKFIKKVENYDIKAYEEALKLDIKE